MKLNTNTLVPKIMKMKTEVSMIEKVVGEVYALMTMNNEIEFASSLEKTIRELPELEYFKEEMDSIKECLIDVFDGYETKEDAVLYMNFMKRVIQGAKDYM
ncbi:MAG: hypothetical protein IJX99_01590 [Clostridia bacterium]|nr:hypothetical protein [Clostridia bacterium]